MLTREQAQKLTEKILKFSKFPECSVSSARAEQAYVRFANNGVTTSGFTVERTRLDRVDARRQDRRSAERPSSTMRRCEAAVRAVGRTGGDRAAESGAGRAARSAEIRRARQLGRTHRQGARAGDGARTSRRSSTRAVAKKLVAAGFFMRTRVRSACRRTRRATSATSARRTRD